MKKEAFFWIITALFIIACVIITIIFTRDDPQYITFIPPSEIAETGISEADGAETTVIAEKININTATAQELTALAGIGETIAARIVEYRDRNGGFDDIEEIKEVSGIGDKVYEGIKAFICVD